MSKIPKERLKALMGLARAEGVPADEVLDRYHKAHAEASAEPECFTLKLDIPRVTDQDIPDHRIYRVTTAAIYEILRPDVDTSQLIEGEGSVTYCVVHDRGFFSFALENPGFWSWRRMASLPLSELTRLEISREEFFRETGLDYFKITLALEALAASNGHKALFIGDPL